MFNDSIYYVSFTDTVRDIMYNLNHGYAEQDVRNTTNSLPRRMSYCGLGCNSSLKRRDIYRNQEDSVGNSQISQGINIGIDYYIATTFLQLQESEAYLTTARTQGEYTVTEARLGSLSRMVAALPSAWFSAEPVQCNGIDSNQGFSLMVFVYKVGYENVIFSVAVRYSR